MELLTLGKFQTLIGDGTLYTITLEFESGTRAQFTAVAPSQELEQKTLPSYIDHSLSDETFSNQPKMEKIEFQGPIQLTFLQSRDDVEFRLPNLIEVPNKIKRIFIDSGVTVHTFGDITGVSLVNPVEIELKKGTSSSTVSIVWKQVPVLEIKVANTFGLVSESKVKLRSSGNQVTLSNGTKVQPNSKLQTDLSLNHPLVVQIAEMLSNPKNMKILADKPGIHLPSVKRIMEGKVDAVTLLLIPMELKEVNSGINSSWNFLVSCDASGQKKLLSYEKMKQKENRVTLDPHIVLNGTWAEVVANFNSNHPLQNSMLL